VQHHVRIDSTKRLIVIPNWNWQNEDQAVAFAVKSTGLGDVQLYRCATENLALQRVIYEVDVVIQLRLIR